MALGSHLDRHPEAEITAEEVDITLPGNGFFWSGLGEKLERAEAFAWPLRILNRLALILSALLLGFLYLTVFPDFSARVRHFLVEEKAAAFGYGVLGFAGVFPAVLLLVLTLVGIFLVPLFLLAVAILVTAGYLDLASVIGRATLKERARHPFWPLAAGVLILQLVGLVPWIGGAIVLFATCAGYGAVLKVTLGQWKGRRKTGTEAVS